MTLADRWEGKRFHSPNDAVYHSSGALYFTDPPYGLTGGLDGPHAEMDFVGVFRLDTEGNVTLLIDDLKRPNGIAFSPDEKNSVRRPIRWRSSCRDGLRPAGRWERRQRPGCFSTQKNYPRSRRVHPTV